MFYSVQLSEWIQMLVDNNYEYNFEEFLCTERDQLQWQTEGLLSDKLSVQNAIVILKVKISYTLV